MGLCLSAGVVLVPVRGSQEVKDEDPLTENLRSQIVTSSWVWSQFVTSGDAEQKGTPYVASGHQSVEKILTIRGEKVILASDLAEVYGVATKALNQAVKRNAAKFPADFAFQLAREEAQGR